MRKHILAGLTFLAISGAAQASLIGDVLTIRRLYPTATSDYAAPVTTTVAAGLSDAVSPQPSYYLINPEAETIHIDFTNHSSFIGAAGGTFDGFSFSGFSGGVSNVSLLSAVGIDIVSLTHDGSVITLNLQNAFTPASYVEFKVESGSPALPSVPEPSAVALMGLGLAGLFLYGRRARKA